MTNSRAGFSRYTLGLPVILFVFLALAAADFLGVQNLSNLIGQVAALLLVSLGQLLVALVAGVDLSVGSVVSLSSCLVAVNADPWLGILLAVLLGVAVGLVNGCGVTLGGIHPFVMSLSSVTFLQGLAFLLLPIPGGHVPPLILGMAKGAVAGVPAAMVWCALACIVLAVVLHRTRLGLHFYAVGANAASARLNGVRGHQVTITAYVLCSLLAVAAGVYLAGRVSSGDPTIGSSFGLESITAVALGGVRLTGGVGGVIAVLAGTATLGLVANGINLLGISPFLRAALTGALLLVAICSQRRKMIGL
jgi:ribose transport system permease protein